MRNVSFSRTLYRDNKIQSENGSENDTEPKGNPVSLSVKVLEKILEEAAMICVIPVDMNMNDTAWTLDRCLSQSYFVIKLQVE